MSLKARFKKHLLEFKRPSGTSRGVLTTKPTWFIELYDSKAASSVGTGECALLPGLSYDDRPDYEAQLEKVCANPEAFLNSEALHEWPSIRFGLEMAHRDLIMGGKKHFYDSNFTVKNEPIPINGLVWMGEKHFMFDQIKEKLETGYTCIKLKIGAINFQDELDLLGYVRKHFDAQTIEIRVDANGAFAPKDALEKLKRLSDFELHSIEQPIKANQWQAMAKLCASTPLPIALDEELIGVIDKTKQAALLDAIQPQYCIFKPSLLGGFHATEQWITLCKDRNIQWWNTSALESNIGLNAIAQWTATLNNPMPQGLGTGQLYTNNVEPHLHIEQGELYAPAQD